jgi:hypothetical protein
MDVLQDILPSTNTICVSGLVARGQWVAIRNLLRSLQDTYLKAAVEFMKTNPTETLAVVICLTPLDMAVFGETRFPAYRVNCLGVWRNTGLRYMKLEFLQKYPFTLRQDTILKRYQLVKQYKILLPTREDWCMPGRIALSAGVYGPRGSIGRAASLQRFKLE